MHLNLKSRLSPFFPISFFFNQETQNVVPKFYLFDKMFYSMVY